jgi:hypothetical protein
MWQQLLHKLLLVMLVMLPQLLLLLLDSKGRGMVLGLALLPCYRQVCVGIVTRDSTRCFGYA